MAFLNRWNGQVELGTCFIIYGGSQGQRDLLFERLGLDYEPANQLVKDSNGLKAMIKSSPPKLLRFNYSYGLDVHYFLYNHRRGRLTWAIEFDDLDQVPWHYLNQAKHLVVFALQYNNKLSRKVPPHWVVFNLLPNVFSWLKKHQWAGWYAGGEAFYVPRQTTVEPSVCE